MKYLNLTEFEAEYLFKLVNVDIDSNTPYLTDEFEWRHDLKNRLMEFMEKKEK